MLLLFEKYVYAPKNIYFPSFFLHRVAFFVPKLEQVWEIFCIFSQLEGSVGAWAGKGDNRPQEETSIKIWSLAAVGQFSYQDQNIINT